MLVACIVPNTFFLGLFDFDYRQEAYLERLHWLRTPTVCSMMHAFMFSLAFS